MPTFILTPSSTVSIADVLDETGAAANTSNAHLKIQGADNGTYLEQNAGNNADSFIYFNGTVDQPDVAQIDTLSVHAVVNILGAPNDDTFELWVKVVEADGTTELAPAVKLCEFQGADAIAPGSWITVDKVFPTVVSDVSRWSGAQFYFQFVYVKSKGADNAGIAISQSLLSGDYSAATELVPAPLYSAATIQGGAVDQISLVQGQDLGNGGTIPALTVAQTQLISTTDLAGGSSIEQGVVNTPQDLFCTSLTAANTIQAAQVQVLHEPNAQSLTNGGTIEAGEVIHIVGVLPEDLSGGGTVTSAKVPVYEDLYILNVPFDINGIPLACDNLYSRPTIFEDSIEQRHYIVSTDLTNGGTIEQGGVDFTHAVQTTGLTNRNRIWQGAVDTEHHLGTTDLRGIHTVVYVVLPGVIETQCDSLTGANRLTEPTLTQDHNVFAFHLSNGQTIEQEEVWTEHWLIQENLLGFNTIEGEWLIQDHPLPPVPDLTNTHTISQEEVIHTHALVPQNLRDAGTISTAIFEGTQEAETTPLHQNTNEISAGAIQSSHETLGLEDLSNSGTLMAVLLLQDHQFIVEGLSGPGTISEGKADTEHDLDTTDLHGEGTISSDNVVIEYKLTCLSLTHDNLIRGPELPPYLFCDGLRNTSTISDGEVEESRPKYRYSIEYMVGL